MEAFAFIDESGTDGMALSKAGNTPCYALAAVVLGSDVLDAARGHFATVRSQRFQSGAEMRSSTVGNNFERRKKVLRDLMSLECQLYVLLVDKRSLRSPGYHYPKSFTKNLHDRLYGRLRDDFGGIHVLADRIKNPPFMDEFKRYIDRKHESDLFRPWSFGFADSKHEVCVQAADMVAGSIAKCFINGDPEQAAEIQSILGCRITLLERFPDPSNPYIVATADIQSSEHDAVIENRSLLLASEFVTTHGDDSDPAVAARVNCLQVLLTRFHLDQDEWIPAERLCEEHFVRFGERIESTRLRNWIIAPLRDASVLIASRRIGGYKLPSGMADLVEFVNTQNEKIKPMVDRIGRARDTVLRATNQKVDILSAEEFSNLQTALSIAKAFQPDR